MKRIILTALFVFFIGCGYQMESTKRPLNLNIRSIAIAMVKSPSSYLGFEAELTRMIRQEFISHSGLRIVPEDQADAVLVAEIEELKKEPIGYTVRDGTYEVTNSRWLRVKMRARLIDRRTGRVIWQTTLRERAAYSVEAERPDPLATRYHRNEALHIIGKHLAERIYLRTMERF